MNKKYGLFLFLLCISSLLLVSRDLYWIGKSSDWNDPKNWSSAANGIGIINKAPSKSDNVFIHESAQDIIMSGDTYCKSLYITPSDNNSFALVGDPTCILHIQEHLKISPSVDNQFLGTIYFEGKSDALLSLGSKKIMGNLLFKKKSTITINNNLIFEKEKGITIKSGDIIVDNVTVSPHFLTITSKKRKRISTINNALWYNDSVLNINPSLSIISDNKQFITSPKATINGVIGRTFSTLRAEASTEATCPGNPSMTVNIVKFPPYNNGLDVSCNSVCDGRAYVSVTGGVGPFSYDWVGYGATGFNDDDTILNLCQGSIGVNVRDNGQAGRLTCSESTFITNPTPISINVDSIRDPSCSIFCDGFISVTATLGAAPYRFNWSQDPNNNTNEARRICADTIKILVTDAGGCSDSTSVILTEPNPVTFNTGKINNLCNTSCDGIAYVNNISGGDGGPYTTLWSTTSNNDTLTDLCPGTYGVVVFDNSFLCFDNATVTIDAGIPYSTTVNITDPTCRGVCDGSIEITVNSGGTPPYTHRWSNGTVSMGSSSTLTNLCAGTYFDTIISSTGCDSIITVTLTNNINNVNARGQVLSNSCQGVCDGSISLTPINGQAPYNFAWSHDNTLTNNTATDLCPGNYGILVTDQIGCRDSVSLTINTIPKPTIDNIIADDTICMGLCEGEISVFSRGSNLSYQWTPRQPDTNILSNLCAGSYMLTITDENQCTTDTIITIDSTLTASNIDIDLNTVNASCGTTCDGSVTVTPSGSQGPYTITWPDNNSNFTRTSLCPQIYRINVRDKYKCSNSSNVNITRDPVCVGIIINNIQSANCFNSCDGSIDITGTGGSGGPYSYTWATASNLDTNKVDNLCAGNYQVTITDVAGRTFDTVLTITQPSAINATISATDAYCDTCISVARVNTVNGGTPPYLFAWGTNASSNVDSIADLCVGTDSLVIEDDNNCTVRFLFDVNSIDGPEFHLIKQDISCNNSCDGFAFTYFNDRNVIRSVRWNIPSNSDTISNLCRGDYTVSITDTSGCSSLNRFIIDSSVININTTLSLASCSDSCQNSISITPTNNSDNNYTYAWDKLQVSTPNIANLCPDSYTVTVSDTFGCSKDSTIIIPSPSNTLSGTITKTNVSCIGNCNGSLNSNITGGKRPYTYLWSNEDTTPNLSNLCEGEYSLLVTDSNGCSVSLTDTINQEEKITTRFVVDNPTACEVCDGLATVIVTNPVAGVTYTYKWNDASNFTSNNTVNNICAGTHKVVISSSNGCLDSFYVNVNDTTSSSARLSFSADTVCTGAFGSVSVSAVGDAPFTYLWNDSNGTTNDTLNNVPVEAYFVTVTDVNNCVVSGTVSLTSFEPLDITLRAVNPSCSYTSDGSISASVLGGSGIYRFNWSESSSQDSILNNLTSGLYTVRVEDTVNNCITEKSAIIDAPLEFSLRPSQKLPSCNDGNDGIAQVFPINGINPITYSWDKFSEFRGSILTNAVADSSYLVAATDDNGCVAVATIVIENPEKLSAKLLGKNNVSCLNTCDAFSIISVSGGQKPYTLSWDKSSDTTLLPNDLCVGVNTLTTTDAKGCTNSFKVIISSNDSLMVTANVTDRACLDDTISLDGTIFGNNDTVFWHSITNNIVIDSMLTSRYVVTQRGLECLTVTVENTNCTYIDTTCVDIIKPTISLALENPNALRIGDSTKILSTSPTGDTYAWTPNVRINDSTSSNPVVYPIINTTYKVIVSDIYKCTNMDSITVKVSQLVTPPDAITPNGDGVNDIWNIQELIEFPINKVTIMTKWGEVIYTAENYDNSWDGTKDGKPLPIGTYYYILEITDERISQPITGPVLIIR